MPLNILPKKSWNPYSPAAIARVRADEAAAQERQKVEDLQQIGRDAERRLALLRGESPPPEDEKREDATAAGLQYGASRVGGREGREGDDRRKRRKLAGEDDTDRDIRLAMEAAEPKDGNHSANGKNGESRTTKSDRSKPAPITDRDGHIQLFTNPQNKRSSSKAEKNPDAEAERKDRERENEGAMRFSDAAGYRQKIKDSPWYMGDRSSHAERGEAGRSVELMSRSKATFDGSSDRGTQEREERKQQRAVARMDSADPMTAMKSAQSQLKRVEREREDRRREREWELEDLKREQERQDRKRERRKRHRNGIDDMDHFSLDATPQEFEVSKRHSRHKDDDRDHRHRHREHRHRQKHHRERDSGDPIHE